MQSSAKYAAISAKIRVMYGRRITNAQYNDMLNKSTVSEITAFLKETLKYRPQLSGINEKLIHRGQLEDIIRRGQLEEYLKLYSFATGGDKKILDVIFKTNEIYEVINFLRFFKSGRSEEYPYAFSEFINRFSKLDFSVFHLARTVDEMVSLFAGSDYYDIILQCRQTNDIDIVKIENKIYTQYYFSLYKSMSQTKNSRAELKKFVSAQIDVLNIIKILRLKKYYNVSSVMGIEHLIHKGGAVPDYIISEMLNAESYAQAEDVIKKTIYNKLFFNNSYPYLEEYYYQMLHDFNKKIMTSGQSSILVVIAYLFMCEVQTKNLITIIEGKRYNTDKEKIKDHLVL